jgi:hypothetical protein
MDNVGGVLAWLSLWREIKLMTLLPLGNPASPSVREKDWVSQSPMQSFMAVLPYPFMIAYIYAITSIRCWC